MDTLTLQALHGDPEAKRLLMGSYNLVKHRLSGRFYRTKYDTTSQFITVDNVHDAQGFLLECYWNFPILENN